MNSKLGNKISFHSDKAVIYEENKIKVTADTRPKSALYINSMTTVTNFRIILSQKMLFGGYQVRYVISVNNAGPEFGIN
jgi:hypothetical protein